MISSSVSLNSYICFSRSASSCFINSSCSYLFRFSSSAISLFRFASSALFFLFFFFFFDLLAVSPPTSIVPSTCESPTSSRSSSSFPSSWATGSPAVSAYPPPILNAVSLPILWFCACKDRPVCCWFAIGLNWFSIFGSFVLSKFSLSSLSISSRLSFCWSCAAPGFWIPLLACSFSLYYLVYYLRSSSYCFYFSSIWYIINLFK